MLLACVSVNLDSRAESLSFSSYSPDFFSHGVEQFARLDRV
jgi:hypothetical protein